MWYLEILKNYLYIMLKNFVGKGEIAPFVSIGFGFFSLRVSNLYISETFKPILE